MTDKALRRFALQFREGILCGNPSDGACAMVCYPIETLLGMQGVDLRTETLGWTRSPSGCGYHVLLRLADGRVLDPTADQFGLDPVYLGPMPQIYLEWR